MTIILGDQGEITTLGAQEVQGMVQIEEILKIQSEGHVETTVWPHTYY